MLEWAAAELQRAGIDRPVFEAQLLLAHALGLRRTDVLVDLDRELSASEAACLRGLLERRAAREPMAYVRGTQEFYGLAFGVSPAVLVPRPETEHLVEVVLEAIAALPAPVVLDVGSGSGCIAVTVAAHAPRASVLALDVSADALAVAAANARAQGALGRVHFVHCDLLSAVAGGRADVVASNPPYIPSADVGGLQAEVRVWEPRVALDGGPDGLTFQRALVAGALRVLRGGGLLALEVAMGQAAAVAAEMGASGYVDIGVRKDLAGIDRIVSGRKPHEGAA